MASTPEPTNAEVMAALDKTHDELVVRKRLDDRWRTIVKRLLAVALTALFLLLACMVTLVVVAIGNRGVLRQVEATGQEVKDCTTPADQTTGCQRRLAESQRPVLKALSEDNLRASVSVGTCLRNGAPDVEACALEEFRKRSEAAKKAAESPP